MTAILKITDGTTTIDLLQAGVKIGVSADAWTPKSPPIIPTFQQSPLTDGRQVSSYKFNNTEETIEHKISGTDQDDTIRTVQDFRRLLLQGIDYHVVDWHNSIVYIVAKASCETNTRYAIIEMFELPEDDFPYGAPFLSNDTLMNDMVVTVQRGHWLSNIPGTGTCTIAKSQQTWDYTQWEINTSLPTADVFPIFQVANGDIYAGDTGQIIRTQNDGGAWAVNLAGAPLGAGDIVRDIYQLTNGYILAGTNAGIIRTTDGGASWNDVSDASMAQVNDIIQLSNGDVIVVGEDTGAGGRIWISSDNAATWATAFDAPEEDFQAVGIAFDGSIIAGNGAGGGGFIYKSPDNGTTWNIIDRLRGRDGSFSGRILQITLASDNNLYILALDGGGGAAIYRSKNNGDSWGQVFLSNESDLSFQGIVETSIAGKFLATATGIGTPIGNFIYVSDDFCISWKEEQELDAANTVDNQYRREIIEAANGSFYAGGETAASNHVYRRVPDPQTVGENDSCTGKLYTINKQNIAQLTHIKLYDASAPAFTDIYPISSFPQELLPNPIGNGDIIYFGIETPALTDTGPFSNLVFNIGDTVFISDNFLWQYYNGAWVVLTVTDNTGFSKPFEKPGINSVHWEQPSDWTTSTVDGVTAYWVRLEVTIGTSDGIPTQIDDQIYTIVNSFLEIEDDNIAGDIPALARYRLTNESDKTGIGPSPNLPSQRVICGLRSLSRGKKFRAVINISDEQNEAGVEVSADTNTTFGNDATTPTGRRATYAAAIGDTTFVDRATVTFSAGVVEQYYGKFHIYLRGRQVTGSAGDITLRIQLRTSSGGIEFTTPEITFSGTNDWELLDFDAITIPAGGRIIKPDEQGDEGVIAIQAKNGSGETRDVYLYDMILIPTDEWSGNFSDLADSSDSEIARFTDGISRFLEIDSVTNPKVLGRSIVRKNDTEERITANYEFDAPGEVILQANADQRLFVISANIGSNNEWISLPEVGWSIKILSTWRYLTQRGDR